MKYAMWESWMVHLHDPLTMPQSNEWNKFEVRRQTFNLITWKLSSFKLLESPYPTNCIDYRLTTKYRSRKDCIRKCRIGLSTEKCGVNMKGNDIERGEPTVLFGNSKKQSCYNTLNFTGVCIKRCPHYDCVINYYKPVLLHKAVRNQKTSPGTLLQIQIPSEPETSFSHSPKIELVEFICYMASTLNMWFGFSMYSFYYLFTACRSRVSAEMSKHKNVLFEKKKPRHFVDLKLSKSVNKMSLAFDSKRKY
jgi:hypothetical protein